MLQIKVKYHNPNLKKLEIRENGDAIDLRSAETVELKAGETKLISLGVSIQLPEGYTARLLPRSSTFKNFGVIQVNSMGLIDESYCGNNDIWRMQVYALRDTTIRMNDRICQFYIQKKDVITDIEEVDSLNEKDRGGFGSTGIN